MMKLTLVLMLVVKVGVASADPVLDQKIRSLYQRAIPAGTAMSSELFLNAMLSYCSLMESPAGDWVTNPDRYTIADFNQPSGNKRLFVYDVKTQRLILNTHVSHAIHSEWNVSVQTPQGERLISSYSKIPAFFSNVPQSNQSSLGMTIAYNETYDSNAIHWGEKQGLSLRLRGIDGGLNSKMESRGTVVHGLPFTDQSIAWEGVPTSEGCLMVKRMENEFVIASMLGGPVMLYHDRLDESLNEDAYLEQKAQIRALKQEIASKWASLASKRRLDAATSAKLLVGYQSKLAPLEKQIEQTYLYFKKNLSSYIVFDPADPARCAARLGI